MMAKKRILSWLVAASLALSLLPAAALAADEAPVPPDRDTIAEKTAGSISDAIYNTSTGKEGIENAEKDADALNKAVENKVGTVTIEKDEDGNVTGGKAVGVDTIVKDVTEKIQGKKDADGKINTEGAAQGVIDAAENTAKDSIDDSVKNKDVTYKKVTTTVNEDGTLTVTEENGTDHANAHVDDYVGKITTDENGDITATGKAGEIVVAAKNAQDAYDSAQGIMNDLANINTAPTTEAEKQAALGQAQSIADAVKEQADAAQAAADEATNAYNAAKAAYEAALKAYQDATGKGTLVGADENKDLSELGGTVAGDLSTANTTATGATNAAKKDALAQLETARNALEEAEGIKAQAEKAQADAIAAQAYAESAQSIADAIKECLDAKESDKLSAKVELLKQLQDSIDKQLENVDKEQVSKDSNRLAWIEGVNGEQGELNIQKGLRDIEQTTVNNLTPTVEKDYKDWQKAEKDVTDVEDQINALGNPTFGTSDYWAKVNLETKLIGLKLTASSKKTNYNVSKGQLERATNRRDGYQAKVDKLEAERAEIRENNGANIDLYRLAVQTDVFGPSVILSDSVVAALQEEIDYRAKTAQQAAATAKDATDKYNAAKAAVAQAKKDVEALTVAGPNVDAARRAAEQRLLDAKAALDEAEDVKNAAIEFAGKAIKDYNTAVDTVSGIESIVIPTVPPVTGDDGTTGDDDTTIEDGIVPLALMPTRGELMNYLYVRAGSPAAQAPTFTDVPADHDYAAAIGWAQQNGVAVAYEDGTFDPDNFVIAADLTGFLTRYAEFAGMTMPTLTTMAALADDDIVDNADEILAEFFGD